MRRRRHLLALQAMHQAGTCPSCHGTGQAPLTGNPYSLVLVPCANCDGTGRTH